MSLYPAGWPTSAPLTGAELVEIDNGGAIKVKTLAASIAGLSGSGVTTDYVSTPITTVGNGTLTAAGLIGGIIARTGPVAAYSDATDTAAAIIAAIGAFVSGATIAFIIKNATAFPQTITAGTGVTMSAINVIGPFSEGEYYATVGGTAAVPTLVITHIQSGAIGQGSGTVTPQATALNTVGAGVVTAASVAGGIVTRGGAQTNTAFTDTTDTGTAIVAANPGLIGKIGASALFWYQNTTNANATLTGGVGVTVSGVTVVPANGWALYLLTQTAANVLTMVGIAQGVPSTANGTFVANGASAVVVGDTRITANSVVEFGLKTIGGTPAGAPFLSAVTAGTGFSVKAVAGDTSTYNYRIVG